MKGIVSTIDLNRESLTQKVKASPGLIGRDLVKEVSCGNQYVWKEAGVVKSESIDRTSSSSNDSQLSFDFQFKPSPSKGAKGTHSSRRFKVVALDYGIKQNILKKLNAHGCDVIVLPCQATAKEILALEPDGIFLSNGPGDPEGVPYVIETVRELIVTKKPIFGICLGHQILGLAFGGRTFKLKFGHRGANQPVLNLESEKVEITAQNHGFCVDMDSLKGKGLILTHINLNDKTCEGMRHEELPIFSVQYHPEASPGPHDADYLFDEFTKMMAK
jgi:carbamoyl-phosphate synthase small subunit